MSAAVNGGRPVRRPEGPIRPIAMVGWAALLALCGAWIAADGVAADGVARDGAGGAAPRTPIPAEDLPDRTPRDGFAASGSCSECHADEHASWKASYHRTMTQVATPEAVLGKFDGTRVEYEGARYHVFERDGEFWAEMPDPDLVMDLVQMRGHGDAMRRIPLVERRVVMTTGSHHYQTYWVAGDDRYGRLLQTLALVYLPKEQRWMPREEAFLRPPGERFLTQWNHHCIKCHSTGGVPGLVDDGGRGRFETRVAELGIACEACHGPGAEHVAHHRAGVSAVATRGSGAAAAGARRSDADPTIVNPAKLSHDRSSQVCGQCHGVFIVGDEAEGMGYAVRGESYRPGDDLHASRYYIEHPNDDPTARRKQEFEANREFYRERWWDDGSILAGGREYTAMKRSGCFLRGEMSCLSCHSMHDSEPADQLRHGLAAERMCTQCHGEPRYTTDISSHTHHAPGSSGSDCLNCHMPYNSYALFEAIRSHQMRAPRVAASIEHGTPNACNLCHLDRSIDWAQQATRQWYGHEPAPTEPEHREVAAGALWMLKGDAAQRAVVAWNAGWEPARSASGDWWIGLFAGRLLADPYSVVRYIAHDTLQKLPGFESFSYDFLAPPTERSRRSVAAIVAWARQDRSGRPLTPELLFGAGGKIDAKRFDRLFAERNNRPVTVKE